MHGQNMAQNSSFVDEINREATKLRTDAHLQKNLPGLGILLKITQTFIKIFWELVICKEFIFPVSKIFQILCPLCYASHSIRPIQSNYYTPSTD